MIPCLDMDMRARGCRVLLLRFHISVVFRRGDVKGPRENGVIFAFKILGPLFPKGTGAERQTQNTKRWTKTKGGPCPATPSAARSPPPSPCPCPGQLSTTRQRSQGGTRETTHKAAERETQRALHWGTGLGRRKWDREPCGSA